MKSFSPALLILAIFTAPAFATVTVTTPSNGETVGSNVQFTASATTSTCSQGVASMGVYIDNKLDYVVDAINLNTSLSLPPGGHYVMIEEWDNCGGANTTPINITVSNQSGVSVVSPSNGATVSSPANYVATATTSCAKGVSAMGVYVNNQLVNTTQGAKLNTQIPLSAGAQNTVVEEWDGCGGAATTPIEVTVGGKTLSNLQATGGWNQWGELPPADNICSAPCPGVTWAMTQHEKAVSLSGNGTQFNLGGTTPYADVLFSNPVLGQGTTENIADTGHTLLPTLHNFTYDAYVYVTNESITQSLEFDVNTYMNTLGMEWGTQCNHLGDGDWDIWNNVNATWFSTGAPCNLINKAWNHVTLQVQRESNNDLLYQTITMNGVIYNINQTVAPFSVPSSWWGMTLNFQMDGNYNQSPNTTYLDNFTFTYF
jgi:hypothetical protein